MLTIDGIPAGKIYRPESVAELAEMIGHERGAVVPAGAGTQLEFGNSLRQADRVIDMMRLSRITTYNPAELTIHVEAGATLGQIQSALAANNQVLPLDPWTGPSATIGGIAATNAQGPLRATGTIRDWIIGMTVVLADGRIAKTGGRVVKNVTGYDLAKLYTGSLGTLAVIAEISFKVRPQFGKTATAIAQFPSLSDALNVLAQVRHSPLAPIACELVGPEHAIWLRLGEHPDAVAWQVSQLPRADWKIVEADGEAAEWETLRTRFDAMGPVIVRAVVLPSAIGGILEAYRPTSWIAHAMNGIVLMALPTGDAIPQLRRECPAVIEKAPAAVRRQFGVFGTAGAEKRLMLEMKKTFDPDGLMNPGRHIDGE